MEAQPRTGRRFGVVMEGQEDPALEQVERED
jgi:hypothetical protein